MEILRRQDKRNKMRDLRRARRRKIIIQKLIEGEDEWGNQTTSWVDWQTVWAERSELWGQEYFAARAVGEQNTVGFAIRHAPFVEQLNTTEYRVAHEDRAYDIKQIDHLKDDGMWVKLRCLEAGSDG